MKTHTKVRVQNNILIDLNMWFSLDSTLIMQLLRDNLTLWTTDMPGDGDNAHNEVQDVDDDPKWLIRFFFQTFVIQSIKTKKKYNCFLSCFKNNIYLYMYLYANLFVCNIQPSSVFFEWYLNSE